MHEVLNRNVFVVKEHIALLKAANNYDIFDPDTGEVILECREPSLGSFTKLLRFSKYKRNTPFDVHILTPSGKPIIRVSRGITFIRSKVKVFDESQQHIGGFRQKLLSIG